MRGVSWLAFHRYLATLTTKAIRADASARAGSHRSAPSDIGVAVASATAGRRQGRSESATLTTHLGGASLVHALLVVGLLLDIRAVHRILRSHGRQGLVVTRSGLIERQLARNGTTAGTSTDCSGCVALLQHVDHGVKR